MIRTARFVRPAGGGDVYRGAAPNSRGSRDGRKRLGDLDASDTYNLPGTQEQILQEMIQSPQICGEVGGNRKQCPA